MKLLLPIVGVLAVSALHYLFKYVGSSWNLRCIVVSMYIPMLPAHAKPTLFRHAGDGDGDGDDSAAAHDDDDDDDTLNTHGYRFKRT